MPTHHLTPQGHEQTEKEDICLFAETNFRNQMRRFGIKTDDRRRHMYVIGKTGMGKTTMLENMVLQDIYNGHGVGVVDPHGDFAEKIINYIPPNRVNDIVYFNPADVDYPIGFNILEVQSEEQKHLVAAGLMAVFKKIWPDVWSARMEYILNNTLLALLDYEGSTLLGINRLLADAKFRKKVLQKLKDPVIKSFWTNEFANYEPRYQKEAVAPIQNKIGQFLSASVIRNMVAQVKSTINMREIMDNKKVLIMNLSKGRIGEDNSRLLGGMLITEIQLAAMSRVDMPESERKDFFLYVDEFQNFATPSFANILSEARKYRLSLIMAHQYVMQLDEIVADAVFGNVGSMVTFRVGAGDAEILEKEYSPTFLIEDIVNLPKFQIFLKLMIDGVASQPFSATTMSPIGSPTGSAEKVIRVSRERYGKSRSSIEDKIARWSGMEVDDTSDDDDGGAGTSSAPTKEKKSDQASQSTKKDQKKEVPKNDIVHTATEKVIVASPPPLASPTLLKKTTTEVVEKKVEEIAIEQKSDTQSGDVSSDMSVSEPVVRLQDLLPKKLLIEESRSSLQGDNGNRKEDVSSPANADRSHASPPPSDQGTDAPKKKRKRKRKKKSNDQVTVPGDTAPSVTPADMSHNLVSKEKQHESVPTAIKQDQVVKFDTDDDDAWRSDK